MAQVISTRRVWRTTNDAPTERDRLRRNEHGCGRIEHVRNTARSVWCGQFRLSQALLLPRLTSGRSRRAEKWGVGSFCWGRVRGRSCTREGLRSDPARRVTRSRVKSQNGKRSRRGKEKHKIGRA